MNSDNTPVSYPSPEPILFVLSGLSGVGKDAVLGGLRDAGLPLEFIVTVTTRPARSGEIDGVHYRFKTQDAFREMMASGGLLEWAEVYGNYYGSPRDTVSEALAAGKDVMLKVDVQGVASIKKIVPECVAIFLATPSMADLERRLRARRTESDTDLVVRLETAAGELRQLPLFDYVVFNREGELDRAVADINAIITAEKSRVKPRRMRFQER